MPDAPDNHSGNHPTADNTTRCVEELRAALALHGITLPSLRVDLPTFAGAYAPPAGLIALGNCNTATARKITTALRQQTAQ
jgi:hypothetical protein